jgi:hypothetical protein
MVFSLPPRGPTPDKKANSRDNGAKRVPDQKPTVFFCKTHKILGKFPGSKPFSLKDFGTGGPPELLGGPLNFFPAAVTS